MILCLVQILLNVLRLSLPHMVRPRESALLLRISFACFCMAFKELSVLHFTLVVYVCVYTCVAIRGQPRGLGSVFPAGEATLLGQVTFD